MTFQAPDIIIIDGSRHDLIINPLEMYRERYRRDMVFYQASPNTGCWRGYVAEWEIGDGKLFLINVDGYVSYKGRNPGVEVKDDLRWGEIHPELFRYKIPATLSELFGPVCGRVPATWYSGELRFSERISHRGLRLRQLNGQPVISSFCSVVDGVCGEFRHEYADVTDVLDEDLIPF
jgi:hypothetical protein